jgi:hypothetical protein
MSHSLVVHSMVNVSLVVEFVSLTRSQNPRVSLAPMTGNAPPTIVTMVYVKELMPAHILAAFHQQIVGAQLAHMVFIG